MLTLLHLVALTVTILALSKLFASVHLTKPTTAVVVAVVFSLINVLLGWLIRAVLFVPALLTLGLLFLFVPLIVNTIVLWITDKVIHAFEIKTVRALLGSAVVITVVNGLFHFLPHAHRLGTLR